MGMTLGELARIAGGKLTGDPNLSVQGVASLEEAGPGEITFLTHPKYAASLAKTRAIAAVVPLGTRAAPCPLIECPNPTLAFAKITALLVPTPRPEPGIHASAVLESGVQVGRGAAVSAFCHVGRGTVLGEGVALFPHVTIGPDCAVGEGSTLYPGVVLRERTRVGKRVILHAGVVLGSDGFGFVNDGGRAHKIPQVGRVVVEDDVEIGANSTVDRAALGVTLIGRGSKLDNLVHIGHNCRIGANCLFAAQVGLSGSVTVGDGVVMGGQVGVADHLVIGGGARIGGQAGVTKDVPAGAAVSGYPARPHRDALKLVASLEKLPELRKEVEALKKKIAIQQPKPRKKKARKK